jgi:putative DNA primase/helicase
VLNGINPLSAAEIAQGARIAASASRDELACIVPVPADAPPPLATHYKYGKPAARWEYKSEDGETLFYVCRFNLPGGGKEFLPCRTPTLT